MAMLLLFTLLAAHCSAHAIFQEVWVNGVSQGHFTGIRRVEVADPLYNISSPDIICNSPENNFFEPVAPSLDVIYVNGGDKLIAEWHQTPMGRDDNNPDDPIAKSHKGPVLVYIAPTRGIRSANVENLRWMKIFEDGIDSDGTSGIDRMREAEGKVEFTLPPCIPSGDYIMRAEIIPLHGALNPTQGAQFFMGCAQLRVEKANDTTVLPPTVSIPGLYNEEDPGFHWDIYRPKLNETYKIPGPPVLIC
ncbi:Cys-Gly metallodipeptidase dug1 [Sphaceloma murrayae]|uniref:AA9 family lytic polysaccharide monooxygenase n=1 Tax=Sphaceloma murrayae TaxID=2082308 RepID=A0A2K1R3V7_9PEZI|nr:Cys-Gly metallodipeptidase dug1 [Sphaceloma murrayae]